MTVLLREALTIATTLGHEWGEEQARWLLSHGLTVARDAPSEAAAVVHQESWICGFCGKAGDPSDGPLLICISHLERDAPSEEGLIAAEIAYERFGVALSDSGLRAKVRTVVEAYLAASRQAEPKEGA